MTAIEIYKQETGDDTIPNDRTYFEWGIKYVQWLENKVVELYGKCGECKYW